MKPIIVYTALCGPKSTVQKPLWTPDYVDYICFTDQPGELPAPWQKRELHKFCNDPNRNAKQYKVLPLEYLPDHGVSIWIDANFRVTRGFDAILKESGLVVLFKHFERDCLYDEAVVCKAMGLDDPAVIDAQMARYSADGFPAHYGLPECGTMIRWRSTEMEELMEMWWSEIQSGSRRDQLSFMYCVWKLGMRDKINILNQTSRDGTYHEWTPHISMLPLK